MIPAADLFAGERRVAFFFISGAHREKTNEAVNCLSRRYILFYLTLVRYLTRKAAATCKKVLLLQ
jgi:hypothetical protein